MQRRSLLAALATTGGALGTAGCLQSMGASTDPGTDSSDESGPGSGTSDDSKRDSTDREPTDDGTRTDDGDAPPSDDDDIRDAGANDPSWNPAGGPVETYAVGDRDSVAFPDDNEPHRVTLWNRVDREREVRVAYTDGATEEAEALGPVSVPGGHTVEISLQVPTRYALTVFADGNSLGTVVVGRRWFDCNASSGNYALADGELVDYGTVSTTMACADSTVAARSFDVTARDCGSDGDEGATVTYDGERVRVDGTFVSGSQCAELSLADPTWADHGQRLRLVVDADPQDDGGCVQCVGAIDYTATVDFDVDLPDHVEVAHRRRDDQEVTVAKASRNDHV